MKTVHCTEFWYVVVLGVANCLVAVPLGFHSHRTFTVGGHNAIPGWPLAIVALLLWSWAAWCCGWELLLLYMRRWEPGRSETAPLLVFCSGVITLLLVLGILTI